MNANAYWGLCPYCRSSDDPPVDVGGGVHFGVCETHRTKWIIGPSRFLPRVPTQVAIENAERLASYTRVCPDRLSKRAQYQAFAELYSEAGWEVNP